MEKKKKIAVFFPLDEAHRSRLLEYASSAEFRFPEDPGFEAELADAEVMLGNPEPSSLKQAKVLKWLQLGSAGADQYIGSGILPAGAVLTNASGAYGKSIAEYMIGMVISLFLDLPHYRDNQRGELWEVSGKARHIPGTTALAVGVGDIGGEFARRYRALGGHVIGIKRNPSPKPDYLDAQATLDRLNEFLPLADVVALSLPSTPETYHLMNEKRFALMKQGSILVNVGRGTAVDTDALCRALTQGPLAGAALDVTEPEPLPADHPLWKIPTAFLTPHMSGRWESADNFERVFDIIFENLGRYLRGEPLLNLVNLAVGY